jgi:hypothetical protein
VISLFVVLVMLGIVAGCAAPGGPRSGSRSPGRGLARQHRSAGSTAGHWGPPHRRESLVVTAEDRGADLIVLGAVHNRSLADRVLGSTATEVTKRARCDVLIVRPEKNLGELEVPEDALPK